MNTPITITLPKKEQERLADLALHYGLSLNDFAARVFRQLASAVPTESITEYEHPRKLVASFGKALREYRRGAVSTSL